jgi:WS/DGAT/MGAT family acyltransferase
MPRMSPVDRAFFLLETEQRPMNVGLLVVLAPPAGPRRRRPSDVIVRRMLRCPVGPPFNYRLAPGAWPTLVAGPAVDPAEQLFRHDLPPDSGLQALFARLCEIHVRRLDRARPLWEIHVFDGLAGRRVALYFKTHHGLIDGLGFLRIIRETVSRVPGQSTPQAIWRGLPDTSSDTSRPPAVPLAGWLPAGLELLRAGFETGRTATDFARLLWHLGRRDLGLGRGMSTPFVSTPDVLKAPPTPHRVLGHCALPLERVKATARRGDAKVNDIVLATLDLALSRYLDERGQHAERPLVADVPVALHDASGAGNRISILQVPMGRPGGTPGQRLDDILRETRVLKEEVRTLSPQALFLYSIVEHAIASAIESFNLGDLPMLANAVISNPAGLDGTVYFNGAPVELALPISVVAHHQVLNITVSNYGPSLDVTFIALREAIPDVQALADATVVALHDLERSLSRRGKSARGQGRTPSRRKLPRSRPRTGARPAQPTLH